MGHQGKWCLWIMGCGKTDECPSSLRHWQAHEIQAGYPPYGVVGLCFPHPAAHRTIFSHLVITTKDRHNKSSKSEYKTMKNLPVNYWLWNKYNPPDDSIAQKDIKKKKLLYQHKVPKHLSQKKIKNKRSLLSVP